MASTLNLTFSPLFSLSKSQSRKFFSVVPKRKSMKIRAMADVGPDMIGDFGARDPFPAEIASNFAENVLGNVNTEHKILIPIAKALSLSKQNLVPVSEAMSEDEANKLMLKVVGWRLVNDEGVLKLQGLWKLKDTKCAQELINRIKNAVEPTGHLPVLHLEEPNQVRAQLWTSQVGGLTMNDFIVAARIDDIKTSDLLPRQRVWA